jgi:hypothetical protein
MIYFILYIVIALITTGLLYWFLYDDNDTEVISVLGGIVFPLTVVFLFFCIPVFIVNKIRNR